MGCRQCDIITTPKRRPIVFDRKEQYGRYTSQSYLHHRLPHCCVLLSLSKAPDHLGAIFYQTRRPDCGTAKGILYRYCPAINTINIHPHSGWFFIFGHSPISISRPQVGIMCLPACELLLATRKRVTRIKQT